MRNTQALTVTQYYGIQNIRIINNHMTGVSQIILSFGNNTIKEKFMNLIKNKTNLKNITTTIRNSDQGFESVEITDNGCKIRPSLKLTIS